MHFGSKSPGLRKGLESSGSASALQAGKLQPVSAYNLVLREQGPRADSGRGHSLCFKNLFSSQCPGNEEVYVNGIWGAILRAGLTCLLSFGMLFMGHLCTRRS